MRRDSTKKSTRGKSQAGGAQSPGQKGKAPGTDVTRAGVPQLEPADEQIFRQALLTLQDAGVPFVVAGAFAKFHYTGLWRYTKDLDIALEPKDLKAALDALQGTGFEPEMISANWLAKAYKGDCMIDLLFGTGHGLIPFDRRLFEGNVVAEIFGVRVPLLRVEDIIAFSAYVVARDRFDGDDVLHLIRAVKGQLDWERLLERLGEDWELLLWHLILFDFVYPGHADYLPQELMARLFERVQRRWETTAPGEDEHAFRGMLLDKTAFAVDVNHWGYQDRREKEALVNEKGELL